MTRADPARKVSQALSDDNPRDRGRTYRPATRRLLLVDDDRELLEVMARVLRLDPEIEARTATTVGDALAALTTGRFDAVLSDVDLGEERSGFDIAAAARAVGARIALVTGYVSNERRARAASIGVEIIAKPFSVSCTVARLFGGAHNTVRE